MKVYVDEKDNGITVTYKEDNGKRQYLYVHDKEGFIFKSLADYTKKVRKEVVNQVLDFIEEHKEYYFEQRYYYGVKYIFFNRSNFKKDILDLIQKQ